MSLFQSLSETQPPSLIYSPPTRQQTSQLEEEFDLDAYMEWNHEIWLTLYRFLYYLKLKERNPIYFENLPNCPMSSMISSTTPITNDDTTASNVNGTVNGYHRHAYGQRNPIINETVTGTGETSGRLSSLLHKLCRPHTKKTTRTTHSNVNRPPSGKDILRDTMYKVVSNSQNEDEAIGVAVLKFKCDVDELKVRMVALNELNDKTAFLVNRYSSL
ncbi:unnamed protein product [Ambrosiozyma monospora]|uniref:Unnamed protein product n=1 Tax=Ambrosiozyma monospora TaxID=43982 RepID=A0ACB5SWL1_AMBMO|nr:unnamed protein product [Ambrosiozyma monospora]